jgi:sugar phosphate isomerase/epimerase
MSFDIALSTMWSIGRFPSLADFFRAGRELGFDQFELNHAVNSGMLDGLSLSGIINAIHEPCPADLSVAELKRRNWLISAPDEDDRRRGVFAIQRSIDLAHELGVGALVVHPGRVDIDPALESALVDLYKAGREGQPEYLFAQQRLVAARVAHAGRNLSAVRKSLLELAEHAARRGVQLGLENRLHYHEIPLPDELDELLALDLDGVVGYWHDIGHAQVQENLGFGAHKEWLGRFAARMIGVHLHDVVGVKDHLAAGLGQVDWEMVAGYLPAAALRTCEFHPSNSPEQVADGLKWLVDRKI